MRFSRTNFVRIVVCLFAGLFLLAPVAVAKELSPDFITIGTGNRDGIYYPVGRAISVLVNQSRNRHGLRCSVESTYGSVYNLNTMRLGGFELCLGQSDQVIDAYNGESSFVDKGRFSELRMLFSLYIEPLTVITRKGEEISSANLKYKRIYIGQPGSGSRATVTAIMKLIGWSLDDIREPERFEFSTAQALKALCQHDIDAAMLTVGHPYQPIAEAAATCALEIRKIWGPRIDRLIKSHPAYSDIIIPGSLYQGNPDPIRSMGVVATLLSTSTIDEEIIYQVVKSLFEQFDSFKKSHPRLKNLTRKGMAGQRLGVPLHDGAKRYYIEAGLVESGG